MTPLWNNNSS